MRSVRNALQGLYCLSCTLECTIKCATYQGRLAVTAGILGESTQSDCGLVFGVKLGEM